ncbi:pyridoxal phosphate-dependent transferase [Aspergillus lucknowensis]|uniref:Pyridoxal phosphate-dependent transferase n=1 Tax=Aspergillus lucknowensis TaxID=176173 RepID=A0ABR4LZD6_9EURO
MDPDVTTIGSLQNSLAAHMQNIAWGRRSRSETDFRSDVITTPSHGMLAAMATTTLGDDVFQEDETTTAFESLMATQCGHEAAAFVLSGTMANQLSIRTLLAQPPPCGVLVDARAHMIHFEGGSIGMNSGASVRTVRPSNGRYMVLEDIVARAIVTDDVHKCPTKVLSIENTAGGSVVPVAELRRISEWARGNEIKVHMDGARLFEAVATGAGSLWDYCTLCDMVSLDFSKNLGAPMGAMVLGSARDIAQLRRIRKSIGGGMRQSGPLAAAAQFALFEQFGRGPWGSQGKLRAVHALAKRVGDMWVELGGELLREVETNQVWLNLGKVGVDTERWNELGQKHGLKLDGRRIVLHHQISTEAVAKLGLVFREALRVGPRL